MMSTIRTKILGEVLSAIDTYFSPVTKESGDPIYQVYLELRGEIEKLACAPKRSTNKPKLNTKVLRYYIGEDPYGKRSSFRSAGSPTKESHFQFAHVFGPFRFAKSVESRLNKTREELTAANYAMPTVF